MTTTRAFCWDTSSHDDTPTSRDAIDVFGCKLTDGNRFYLNPTFAAKMNAMRGFGVDTFFAYHVLWGNADLPAQAAWFLAELDALLPWWDDPGITFYVMSDNEPFGYNGAPSVPQVNSWHQYVVGQSGGRLTMAQQVAYSPQWFYGAAVAGLTVKWHQSNYGTNPVGPYRAVYPGDDSPRWVGPRPMEFLQYGSNTIIAGQTTSDASAYAGTLAQLKAALGGDDMTTEDVIVGQSQLYDQAASRSTPTGRNFANDLDTLQRNSDGFAPTDPRLKARLDDIDDALDAIQATLAAWIAAGAPGALLIKFTGEGTAEPAPPPAP